MTQTKSIKPQPISKLNTTKRFPETEEEIVIKLPKVWLALVAFLLYLPTLYFGYTELDDSIFIREFVDYNKEISNLFVSFTRGVFNATTDPYYRPLFLDLNIINYKLFGDNVGGWHFVNVVLHIISVVLLHSVFVKLKIKELHAFILALIFAVHPVITQAVTWIPGRNDTLLAVFTFAFFMHSIQFTEQSKIKNFIWATLMLCLAFFTKETAVFVPPACITLLVLSLRHKWTSNRMLMQYIAWIGVGCIWYVARSMATLQKNPIDPHIMLESFIHRLGTIIQYIGKIILPVNLSVFPIQEDTVYYYGFIALAILSVAILVARPILWHKIAIGCSLFLLFLIPALLVPNALNEQTFEHRLYLPIVGMLLLLPESILFKNKSDGWVLIYSIIICVIFAGTNLRHQRNFESPVSFWTQANETSPNSAYANMMLGARIDNLEQSYALFRKAYRLNPKEKYLGYYYGKMLQMQDSILASEKYLLAEKNTSGYYECDFYLARVAMHKNDTLGSINYLKSYLKTDPANTNANNNLLLMLLDTKRLDDARVLVGQMQLHGVPVPPEVIARLR